MPLLRPGQGIREFKLYEKETTISAAGSVGKSSEMKHIGTVYGFLTAASQKEIEQWKQNGHPISNKIVQPYPRTGDNATGKATQYLSSGGCDSRRTFYIQGTRNPGQIDHFMVYYVEEREDLKYGG